MDIMDSKVNWDTDGIRDTVEIIEKRIFGTPKTSRMSWIQGIQKYLGFKGISGISIIQYLHLRIY